jgi:hypothetical protein
LSPVVTYTSPRAASTVGVDQTAAPDGPYSGAPGRARADHDDALAGVIQVAGPLLRMHDAALEALDAGKLRRIALLVVVVAGAHVQEVAGQAYRLLAGTLLGLDRPARILARP